MGPQRMNPVSQLAKQEIENLIIYLRNNSHRTDYKKMKRANILADREALNQQTSSSVM